MYMLIQFLSGIWFWYKFIIRLFFTSLHVKWNNFYFKMEKIGESRVIFNKVHFDVNFFVKPPELWEQEKQQQRNKPLHIFKCFLETVSFSGELLFQINTSFTSLLLCLDFSSVYFILWNFIYSFCHYLTPSNGRARDPGFWYLGFCPSKTII